MPDTSEIRLINKYKRLKQKAKDLRKEKKTKTQEYKDVKMLMAIAEDKLYRKYGLDVDYLR